MLASLFGVVQLSVQRLEKGVNRFGLPTCCEPECMIVRRWFASAEQPDSVFGLN